MDKRKLIFVMLLILSVAALSVGCGEKDASQKEYNGAIVIEPIMELSEYPICDGAPTALPLAEEICAAVTGSDRTEVINTLTHSGGNAALSKLFDSAAELVIVDKKDGEIKAKASDAGVEVEIIPVARECYIFYTLEDPTAEDSLKDITKEEADAVVMGTSDKDIKYENGYFMSGYLPDNINILAVDGVAPSKETVTSGEYPCSFYYNAVIKADTPADSAVRRIIEVLLSESGQQLAEEAGYVKL